MKYQIRYEPHGGQYYYMIYQRALFGWDFLERWNDSDRAVARLEELCGGQTEEIRPSVELFHRFDDGETCNGMVNYRGTVYVTTDRGVYQFTGDGLEKPGA